MFVLTTVPHPCLTSQQTNTAEASNNPSIIDRLFESRLPAVKLFFPSPSSMFLFGGQGGTPSLYLTVLAQGCRRRSSVTKEGGASLKQTNSI